MKQAGIPGTLITDSLAGYFMSRGEVNCVIVGADRIAPEGIDAANPAFDVTPHRYITAIITEKGIIREPYGERIKRMV